MIRSEMSTIIEIMALSILGAALYRLRGSAVKIPRPIVQILFCSVYAVPMLSGMIHVEHDGWLIWTWFAFALIFSVAECCSGHDQYMDLGFYNVPITKTDSCDWIVKAIFGTDPRLGATDSDLAARIFVYGTHKYVARCWFGLAFTGLAITAVPGFFLSMLGFPLLGLILTFSGVYKVFAYASGWEIFGGTEGGEWLTGFVLWMMALLVAVAIATGIQ